MACCFDINGCGSMSCSAHKMMNGSYRFPSPKTHQIHNTTTQKCSDVLVANSLHIMMTQKAHIWHHHWVAWQCSSYCFCSNKTQSWRAPKSSLLTTTIRHRLLLSTPYCPDAWHAQRWRPSRLSYITFLKWFQWHNPNPLYFKSD